MTTTSRTASSILGTGAVLMSLLGQSAQAQGRPDSLTMTCAQARSLVAARGVVILGTGPHVYDRIVSDQRFCPWPQWIERTTVTTRDARNCVVGYVCRDGAQDWMRLDD